MRSINWQSPRPGTSPVGYGIRSSDSPRTWLVSSAFCKRLRFLRERSEIDNETRAGFLDVRVLTEFLREFLVLSFTCVEKPLEFLFVELRSVSCWSGTRAWHDERRGQGEARRGKAGGRLINHQTALTSQMKYLSRHITPDGTPRVCHQSSSSSAPQDGTDSAKEGTKMCLPLWFNLTSNNGTTQATVVGISEVEVVQVCHRDGQTFLAITNLTAASSSEVVRVCWAFWYRQTHHDSR